MTQEPISEAEYERLFQQLSKDEMGAQFMEAIDELSTDGQAIFQETLKQLILMLHSGDFSSPTGMAVMRAYIEHYFPDGKISSKEALTDLMRGEAKKIQAIAESSFAHMCKSGIIQGPPQQSSPTRTQKGCFGMILVMAGFGLGAMVIVIAIV
ncbi:MAG: hypothetical protein IH984_10325 [Planctomycetes bacterium]|nr:hypothetical protein [Planctomycetota bacterium]